MNVRYVLAPAAENDLSEIWHYIKQETTADVADRIQAAILDKFDFLANNPGVGHSRKDLTALPVKFFPIYAYLIVYRQTTPLEIVSVLHGRREVGRLLKDRT
ncbi:MAG TPA: type II toxin-antitoxin system RelE/ParE family toxin [Terriglobales bacterium]